MDQLERFLTFAEQSPTAFHAAANLAEMLEKHGFVHRGTIFLRNGDKRVAYERVL